MNHYLTQKQVEILIKLYYLRKYTTAAEMLGITVSQIKTIEENGLRWFRLAYSRSYKQGKRFDGKIVLGHMAERSGITLEALSDIFDSYITEGLVSGDRPFWRRVKCKDENPTTAELLDFIYMKYELKIHPFTIE